LNHQLANIFLFISTNAAQEKEKIETSAAAVGVLKSVAHTVIGNAPAKIKNYKTLWRNTANHEVAFSVGFAL
jgi:precorrin isomerase